MAQRGLTVAKPDKDSLDAVHDFVNACESILENQKFSLRSSETEWKSWDDDDDDKKEILAIRRDISVSEGILEDDVDDRILCFEFLKSRYPFRLKHVVMCAEIMIDAVCDPTGTILDYHPGFEFYHVAPEQ